MRAKNMIARYLRRLLFCAAIAIPVLAQEGHPAKGTWVGYRGPAGSQQTRVVIVIDHDGVNLTGTVNPGPQALPLKLARLDITPGKPPVKAGDPVGDPTFKLHLEAETKDAKGNAVVIVADGEMQNVGLPNRTLAGTWTETSGGKSVRVDFRLRRQ